MKSTITIFIILFSLVVFSSNRSVEKLDKKKLVTTYTSLDSLQGKWRWVLDTALTCTITGNNYHEVRTPSAWPDDYSNDEYFRIYFSDTVVDRHRDFTLAEVAMDSTKKTGEYIVLVSQNDSSLYCYQLGRVYQRNNDTFFTITDEFAKRKTIKFQKIQ